MALRQIISRAILPGFEEELANVVGKEVRAMQRDLCPLQSGTAFSYRRAGRSGGGGAFGGTAAAQVSAAALGQQFVKVERPVVSRGLFHV